VISRFASMHKRAGPVRWAGVFCWSILCVTFTQSFKHKSWGAKGFIVLFAGPAK
jgi:hypothetical protein